MIPRHQPIPGISNEGEREEVIKFNWKLFFEKIDISVFQEYGSLICPLIEHPFDTRAAGLIDVNKDKFILEVYHHRPWCAIKCACVASVR